MTLTDVLTRRRRDPLAAGLAGDGRLLVRRLWRQRGARAGLLIGTVLLLLAAFGPWLAPMDPNVPNYADALQGPGLGHWLGTDSTGRDLASRLIDGAQRTLGASVVVIVITLAIGLLVGLVAGLAGGIVDTLLMRLVDVMMTLPGLVLAFAVIGLLGPSFGALVAALVIADWAHYARLARSYALQARSQPYIVAARMADVGSLRILVTHVLPAVAVPLAIVASIDLGGVVGAIAGFSFLGLGVQPPYAEWGAMLAESRFYFTIAPWLLAGPAAMIVLAVLAANLVGNGLRDALDPKTGQ